MHIFDSHFPKKPQYLVNGESYQKSVTSKKDAKFNFLWECVIRFNVSSTRKVLFQFKKKVTKKLKKPHYLINGKFYKKHAWNKKDVKCNFISDMFYKKYCIFNQYNLIAFFIFGSHFLKMAVKGG